MRSLHTDDAAVTGASQENKTVSKYFKIKIKRCVHCTVSMRINVAKMFSAQFETNLDAHPARKRPLRTFGERT